jgi:fatty-acyl-CoA synthase
VTGSATPVEATIGDLLRQAAAATPDHVALVWATDDPGHRRRWTYAELLADAEAIASWLLARFQPGERVAVWAPSRPEWVQLQLGAALGGLILVPLNPAFRGPEAAYVLAQSRVAGVVFQADHRGHPIGRLLDELAPELPELRHLLPIEELAAAHRTPAGGLPQVVPGDVAQIQYTSGTTGFPKGATLSHHNILNNGFFVGELCGYGADDRVCIPVPFYHCFGMTMGNLGCTAHGATVVIPAPGFDPGATLAAVAQERCTSLYGVPTMFIAELADPDFDAYDLTSLRTGIMAGSPCPVEIMKQVVARMGMEEVTICYGMTETSPVSTQTGADDPLERRVSTVGTVHPHVEVKIIHPETGQTVPRGTPGELCTRGYSVMLGYWGEPERTAEVIDAARYMHTGDIAVMDDEGYVNITGRIKDMVIRGGENIYPREIEEFLYSHPDIVDAQVIGVPDARYGEELMVWVQLRPGADDLTAETLRQYCSGRLAHYKIPRYVHVVDEFPMTVTGKVRKMQMREESVVLLGLGGAAATEHA